jgi:hypothetical protein
MVNAVTFTIKHLGLILASLYQTAVVGHIFASRIIAMLFFELSAAV